jgi:hypothetical protein
LLFAYTKTLSESCNIADNNNDDFEESSDIAGPLEIISEEVVEVTEKSNTEAFPLSSKEEEDQKNEIKTDNSNRYNEDIYEQVKVFYVVVYVKLI